MRSPSPIGVLALCALVSGCGGGGSGVETFPPSPKRARNALCVAPEHRPAAGPLALERAFTQLLPNGGRVRKPIQLVPSPSDPSAYYLVLQTGQILELASNPTTHSARTVLDVHDTLDFSRSENGLVSLAFHPHFEQHRFAYVVRSVPSPVKGRYLSRLARFTVREDGLFDRNSELVLLELEQRSASHSGDHVAFGLDGYLYHSHGDDQGVQNAQDPYAKYGAILRIDVDHDDKARGLHYAVPKDNPFARGGGAPEVYAYGLRNPWRFTVDPEDGRIFVGDVGQDSREEIDLLRKGGNYGWPIREGKTCFEADLCEYDFDEPIVDYTHSEGTAVVVGYRYRGKRLPWLRGRLLYADVGVGSVFSIPLDQKDPSARLELDGMFHIVSFAQRPDGELYVVRYDFDGEEGGVYELVAAQPDTAANAFPKRLSQTGCVDPDDPRKPAPGVVAFEPSAALWSDGAQKNRFFAIPDTARLSLLPQGDIAFPIGSVLLKSFEYDGRYHETRLLIHHADGWGGYSYLWQDDQSDAVLLDTGQTVTLPNGQRWLYPSRSQCFRCHTDAAGVVLGPEVGQLDHDSLFDEQSIEQLEGLFEHDYFRPDLERVEELREDARPLPDPFGDGPLADRARAYLHVNCSICHRPGGNGRGALDLRFSRSFEATQLCDQPPEQRLPSAGNAQRLLRPGHPDDSVLWLRMNATDRYRMPPLASNRVDQAGAALVRAWIESIASCAAPAQ
ncbi:MAG: PQQ-dependent sugar dehydrogenase [Polyangiales bacterium]